MYILTNITPYLGPSSIQKYDDKLYPDQHLRNLTHFNRLHECTYRMIPEEIIIISIDYMILFRIVSQYSVSQPSNYTYVPRFRMIIKCHHDCPSESYQHWAPPSNESIHPVIGRLLKDRHCKIIGKEDSLIQYGGVVMKQQLI